MTHQRGQHQQKAPSASLRPDSAHGSNSGEMQYEGLHPVQQQQQQLQYQHQQANNLYQSQSAYFDPNSYHQQPYHHAESSHHDAHSLHNHPSAQGGSSRSPLPSMSRELQSAYTSSQFAPRYTSHRQAPSASWSSVQPASPAHGILETQGVSVKLEDLVSQDRDTSGTGGNSKGAGGFNCMPLNSNHNASAGPSTSKSAAAGNGEVSTSSAPSEFIKKLYKMLEEEAATYGKGFAPGQPRGPNAQRGSVGWARGGTTFVVWEMNIFTTKVLPQTFRHSNFSSFVRQLNKYGFSKIKHVDEETGAIRENVWEFQHQNFQAGGKSELDLIKRKLVVSKKTEVEEATSPAARAVNLPVEDTMRMAEMENRVRGLEEHLAVALEEIRQAKTREQNTTGLLREMLSHMASTERGSSTAGTPVSDGTNSSRMRNMWQMLEQITSGFAHPAPPVYGYTNNQQYPIWQQPGGPAQISPGSINNNQSPQTDESRRSKDSGQHYVPAINSGGHGTATVTPDDHEMGGPGAASEQAMFPDGLLGAPEFADTPAWLTEGVTVPMSIYHRKASDGAALRLMMNAMATRGQGNQSGEAGDPLLSNMDHGNDPSATNRLAEQSTSMQPSPFGSLVIPSASSNSSTPRGKTKGKGSKAKTKGQLQSLQSEVTGDFPRRRSSVIKPHWTKTPRILVVEDDMVYRQLSSKFLEKFGCVVETVENAQEAIAMINETKYDLVLMDIFFGPSMDGRKATSLIRQFDQYTPIISMTSNAQPKDVDSYYESGMNDILAKPFTKHGLFGILDKHLLHMKGLQLSAEVPRSVGVPPLSDSHVRDAIAQGAAESSGLLPWGGDGTPNPLAGMGVSDEAFQNLMDQFLQGGLNANFTTVDFQTGQITPHTISSEQFINAFAADHIARIGNGDVGNNNAIGNGMEVNNNNNGGGGGADGTIGTNVVFGDFNTRKRSLEADDGWEQTPEASMGGGAGGGGGMGQVKTETTFSGNQDVKRTKH